MATRRSFRSGHYSLRPRPHQILVRCGADNRQQKSNIHELGQAHLVHHEVSVVAVTMVMLVNAIGPKSYVASSCNSMVRIACFRQRYLCTLRPRAYLMLPAVYGTGSGTAAYCVSIVFF